MSRLQGLQGLQLRLDPFVQMLLRAVLVVPHPADLVEILLDMEHERKDQRIL